MSHPTQPLSNLPTSSQLESLNALLELDQVEMIELPSDKRKYLQYGYLVQAGRILLTSGKVKSISSTDLTYLPPPKARWDKVLGGDCEIIIDAGKSYTENLDYFGDGELQLKASKNIKGKVDVKIYSGRLQIPVKVEKFLSLVIISFTAPKSGYRKPMSIEIQNLSNEQLILNGINSKLKIRYVSKSEMGRKTFARMFKRGVTLLKNGEYKAFYRAFYYKAVGKLQSMRRGLNLVFITFLLSSCVLPPDSSGPRVFSNQEISFIADTQKGISYSQAGRFDQAEFNLRKALASTNSPPVLLLSNLGFVLRAQGKYSDALVYLRMALAKDPYFLHARVVLGRTYFEMGDIDSSIAEYLIVERDFLDFWKGAPDSRLSNGFTSADLLSVYSTLAIMLAQKGLVSESICYSQKALSLNSGNYKPQAHARFLISLEEFYLAGEVLRQVIFTGSQVTAPLPPSLAAPPDGSAPLAVSVPEEDPSSILDLGVVRLLEKNLPLAAEAFDRVLTLTIVPSDQRLLTKLLRYETAAAQNDNETIGLLGQSFSEVTEGLCESDSYVTPPYWPIRLRDQILERRKEICRTYG